MNIVLFLNAIFGNMSREVYFITGQPDCSGKWVDSVGTSVDKREWKESAFSWSFRTKSVQALTPTPENSGHKQRHYWFANFI